MDEDDLACRDFAKAVAFVDEPLVDDQRELLPGWLRVRCRSPRPFSSFSILWSFLTAASVLTSTLGFRVFFWV